MTAAELIAQGEPTDNLVVLLVTFLILPIFLPFAVMVWAWWTHRL